MGFTGMSAMQNARKFGKVQHIPFFRSQTATNVTQVPHSLHRANGFYGSATTGTKGKANGRVLTGVQSGSPSAGATPFLNPSAGETLHVDGLLAWPSGSGWGGTLYLIDRIAECNVDASEASGNFTGLTAVSRLESGQGGQILLNVTTALSAATTTFNLTYTNEAGVSGRVTPNFTTVASSIVDRSPLASGYDYVPLQAGDKGVRSIESITLVTNNGATGAFDIAIVRQLDSCQLTAVTSQTIEHDTTADQFDPSRVFPDSFLTFWVLPNSANTYVIGGTIKLVSG